MTCKPLAKQKYLCVVTIIIEILFSLSLIFCIFIFSSTNYFIFLFSLSLIFSPNRLFILILLLFGLFQLKQLFFVFFLNIKTKEENQIITKCVRSISCNFFVLIWKQKKPNYKKLYKRYKSWCTIAVYTDTCTPWLECTPYCTLIEYISTNIMYTRCYVQPYMCTDPPKMYTKSNYPPKTCTPHLIHPLNVYQSNVPWYMYTWFGMYTTLYVHPPSIYPPTT